MTDMMHEGSGSRPIPDPTLLTTQQLNREISALEKLITSRLDAMDKALALYQHNLGRVPSEVDRRVDQLKDLVTETFKLHEERFNSIQIRFHERDMRSDQTVRDSRGAVETALESAEKAVSKSEASFVKQMDQLQILLHSATQGLDGKINDIKDRITIIEGKTLGLATAHTTQDRSTTQWVGIIGLILGAVVGLGGLTMALNSSPDTAPIVERVIVGPPPEASNELR